MNNIRSNIVKMWMFVRRGFITWVSYKWGVALNLMTWGMQALWVFFLGRLINVNLVTEKYGSNFFSFLILGIALQQFLSASIYSYRTTLRNEQIQGTLEMALLTPTKLSTFVFGQGIWSYIKATIGFMIFLILGVCFGMQIVASWIQLLSAMLVLLLLITSMMGFGLISAGIILITKEGDPLSFALYWANYLFTGLYYPVESLPPYLQKVSFLFPLTYGLKSMRLILLKGSTLADHEVLMGVIFLIGFSCLMVPLGLFLFRKGFDKARERGSLAVF